MVEMEGGTADHGDNEISSAVFSNTYTWTSPWTTKSRFIL